MNRHPGAPRTIPQKGPRIGIGILASIWATLLLCFFACEGPQESSLLSEQYALGDDKIYVVIYFNKESAFNGASSGYDFVNDARAMDPNAAYAIRPIDLDDYPDERKGLSERGIETLPHVVIYQGELNQRRIADVRFDGSLKDFFAKVHAALGPLLKEPEKGPLSGSGQPAPSTVTPPPTPKPKQAAANEPSPEAAPSGALRGGWLPEALAQSYEKAAVGVTTFIERDGKYLMGDKGSGTLVRLGAFGQQHGIDVKPGCYILTCGHLLSDVYQFEQLYDEVEVKQDGCKTPIMKKVPRLNSDDFYIQTKELIEVSDDNSEDGKKRYAELMKKYRIKVEYVAHRFGLREGSRTVHDDLMLLKVTEMPPGFDKNRCIPLITPGGDHPKLGKVPAPKPGDPIALAGLSTYIHRGKLLSVNDHKVAFVRRMSRLMVLPGFTNGDSGSSSVTHHKGMLVVLGVNVAAMGAPLKEEPHRQAEGYVEWSEKIVRFMREVFEPSLNRCGNEPSSDGDGISSGSGNRGMFE